MKMEATVLTPTFNPIQNYYASPGAMSEPGEYLHQLQELPRDLNALVPALQSLLIHVFWAERYGVILTEDRRAEVQIRAVRPKLARLLELDPRALNEPRPLEKRLVGNCRDFSLLLAAMLKVHGVPARARCGFGTYFMPGHYEDHWMTEYWQADGTAPDGGRWVQVDAQLDDFQKEILGITFDSLDMPVGQFVLAGEAWQMCWQGKANPDDFGIFEYHGWDFIKGNVLRDLLSLNKIELLPWDDWGIVTAPVESFTQEQMDLIDQVAALCLGGNAAFEAVLEMYHNNPSFHVPQEWVETAAPV